MMVFFNLLLLLLVLTIFLDLEKGFFFSLIAKICVPSIVRLSVGTLSVSILDVCSLALCMSFFVHHKEFRLKLPEKIKNFFVIYVIGTFLLIFMSSKFVPINYQLMSFCKGFLFQTISFLFIGYVVIQKNDCRKWVPIITIVAFLVGLYGIVCYVKHENIYITILNTIYGGEDQFTFFLEEVRGGLTGRTYGTMGHPLAWGQFWNIFLAFMWICRRYLNKYLFLLCLIVGILNIVMCGSRSAIVSSLVFFVFVGISINVRKLLVIISVTYLLLLIVVGSISYGRQTSGVVSYIESAVFFWDSSYSDKAKIQGSDVSMRVNQLEKSVDIMKRNPIAGVGYNYEYYAMEKYGKVLDKGLMGLESIVFKTLVEQGLGGFFLFMYVYFVLKKYFSSQLKRKQRIVNNGYVYMFLASILFTSIQGSSFIFYIVFLFLISKIQNDDTKNNPLLLVKR